MENRELITDIIFILDRSGSMKGLEKETIEGFNSFLNDQRETEGLVYITTVMFNEEIDVVHDRKPIREVKEITRRDYSAYGRTALLDAIGETIKEADRKSEIWKSSAPDRTICVIITDGEENASTKWKYRRIKKLVSKKNESHWKFIFLGANMDAIEAASRIGIKRYGVKTYHSDEEGTLLNYKAVGGTLKRLCCLVPSEFDEYEEEMEEDLEEIETYRLSKTK